MTKERLEPTTEGSKHAFEAIYLVSSSLGKNQHKNASLGHPIKYSKKWTVLELQTPWDLSGQNCFKNLPVNTRKSSLCSHIWSTVGGSGKQAELEFGDMWLSSGSLNLKHLGCLCWTHGYLASPPQAALPSPLGRKRRDTGAVPAPPQSRFRGTQSQHRAPQGPKQNHCPGHRYSRGENTSTGTVLSGNHQNQAGRASTSASPPPALQQE